MSTGKATPGPWSLSGNMITGQDENGSRSPIATISHSWRNREIDKANARLIAAAPSLLEACTFVYNEMCAGRAIKNHELMMSYLKNAIAKAEGRDA